MKAFKFVLFLLLGLVAVAGCGGGSTTGPLDAPSNLTATPGAGEIVLSWQDNSTAEEGFRIFRRLESDAAFPTEFLALVDADVTTYTDRAISSAETYVYQVQPFSSTGEGEFSAASQPVKPTQGAGKVRLTVIRAGSAEGITTSNPPGINCTNPTGGACSLEVDTGTTITLTATPTATGNPPAVFGGFSGACVTTSLTCEVVMDSAKDVTATYNPAQPGLTVQISGEGRVFDKTTVAGSPFINCTNNTGDCDETVYWRVNDRVDLFATPAEGYRFTGWSDNCNLNTSTTPRDRCIFTLGTSTVITATFLEIPNAPIVAFEPLNSGTEDLTYKVGTPLELRWTVQNGPLDSLTLNGAALDNDATSEDITLPATSGANTYTLEARNANPTSGTATKTITTADVPEIGEVTVTPNTGGTNTVTWTPIATGRGNPDDYDYTLTPPGGTAAALEVEETTSGVYTFTLPAASPAGTYLLVASNEFGTAPNSQGTGSDEFTIAAAPAAPIIENFAAIPPGGTVEDTTFAVGGTASFTWSFGASGGTPTTTNLLKTEGDAPSTPLPVTPATSTTITETVTAPLTRFRLSSSSTGSSTAFSTNTIEVRTGTPPATTPATPPVVAGSVAGEYTFNWTQGGTGPVSYVLTAPAGSAAVIPAILNDATTVSITGAVTGEVFTLTATNDYGLTTPTATDPAPVTFTIP